MSALFLNKSFTNSAVIYGRFYERIMNKRIGASAPFLLNIPFCNNAIMFNIIEKVIVNLFCIRYATFITGQCSQDTNEFNMLAVVMQINAIDSQHTILTHHNNAAISVLFQFFPNSNNHTNNLLSIPDVGLSLISMILLYRLNVIVI